jgi:hypothetical protein
LSKLFKYGKWLPNFAIKLRFLVQWILIVNNRYRKVRKFLNILGFILDQLNNEKIAICSNLGDLIFFKRYQKIRSEIDWNHRPYNVENIQLVVRNSSASPNRCNIRPSRKCCEPIIIAICWRHRNCYTTFLSIFRKSSSMLNYRWMYFCSLFPSRRAAAMFCSAPTHTHKTAPKNNT